MEGVGGGTEVKVKEVTVSIHSGKSRKSTKGCGSREGGAAGLSHLDSETTM